jgi:two-component sensor histidine kinase
MNMINPNADINLSVTGQNLELPAQKATSLALVTNELIQNALEHGMVGKSDGNVTVTLKKRTNQLILTVRDNGQGLPNDFNMETSLNLGLSIVQATVMEDMHGAFYIGPSSKGNGTEVKVMIPL